MNRMPKIISAGYFKTSKHPEFLALGEKSNPRTVLCYELEYYPNDSGYCVVNDIEYSRQAGSFLIARPGDIRYSSLPFSTHFFYLVGVEGTFAQVLNSLPTMSQSTTPDRDLHIFQDIHKYFLSAEPADKLKTASLILDLVHSYSHAKQVVSSFSGTNTINTTLAAAKQIIDSRFMEPLTVEDIAQECHVSASYLHRLFADSMGTSPYLLLSNRRITEAKTLLASTDLPMNEISIRSGFATQSHFNECFKRKTGMAPGVFRKSTRYEL